MSLVAEAVLKTLTQKRPPVEPHVPSCLYRPMDVIRVCVELVAAKSGDVVGNGPDQLVEGVHVCPMRVAKAIGSVYDRYMDLSMWEGCPSC